MAEQAGTQLIADDEEIMRVARKLTMALGDRGQPPESVSDEPTEPP